MTTSIGVAGLISRGYRSNGRCESVKGEGWVEEEGEGKVGRLTSLRIERGLVEILNYVCDRLDRAIPIHVRQLGQLSVLT